MGKSNRVDIYALRIDVNMYVGGMGLRKDLNKAIDELAWLRSYQSMGEVAPKEPYGSDDENTDSD